MVGAKTYLELGVDSATTPAQPDELRELKGNFLASLNHEIRTPLSGILGMMDLLLETSLSPEQQEYVAATRICAQNLYEILNAALEYSALSAGTQAPEESEFDLLEALKHTVLEQILQAEAKGLQLYYSLDENLPRLVSGDAVRLRQLLSHLIVNAIKFTNRGEVELIAQAEPLLDLPGRIRLTVKIRDTGIGIPANKLDVIFESFRQVESGLSRGYHGLGLGLALALKLAHLLGGAMSVESQEGTGSTFKFTIPLKVAAEPAPAQARKRDQTLAPKILMVDDNSVAQTIVRQFLRRGRYESVCFDNGPAAIESCSSSTYDLILMDLQMPGMSGLEVTEAIRRLPGYDRVPIIALTANSSEEYRKLCRDAGMQGFLAKPVQCDELLGAIGRLLK
jgi:CheY-like chemotaxis protein